MRAGYGALVLLVGVIAAACAGPSPASGNRLLLIGDSIMNGSRDAVSRAVSADGWDPHVAAQGGSTIEMWVDRTPFLEATVQPNVVVVELGTNDCSATDCPNLQPYIDQIMRSFNDADAVLWLNTQEGYPNEYGKSYVNSQLEDADARWPNLFLVDMDSALSHHPELHGPDQLHPNAQGQMVLAKLIADALQPFRPTAKKS